MNIRFSGFGGQGVVLAGVIYGRAATIEGKNALQTQSYGSASRGGASKSDVIISDEQIYELEFTTPDVLIAMSQEAYTIYAQQLKEQCIVIVEKDLVRTEGVKIYSIPATRIAEGLGQKIMANIVMLGFMSALVSEVQPQIVSKDAVCKAIYESVPKGTGDKNIQAFEEGYKLGMFNLKLQSTKS
ncbi:MAG: 2-oxoacid:acceptor oxidoreductase family protein [Candidatus Stahlbacteria bacterium]|nr:2-oxoacid:acceptor oxidoreductase family protein [Candidatus Stahlbacteria bacterium]